MTLPVALEDQ